MLPFGNTQPSRVPRGYRQIVWPSPEMMRVSAPVARKVWLILAGLVSRSRAKARDPATAERRAREHEKAGFIFQDWTRIWSVNLRKNRRTPEQRAADVSSAEPCFFCRQDAGSTLRFMDRLNAFTVWSLPQMGTVCHRRLSGGCRNSLTARPCQDTKMFL